MTKEKGHPKAALNQSDSYYVDLSAEAQRKRLLDALRCDAISTLEARRILDILHPAMRIRELRLDGYDIQTVRISADTGFGIKHSVARYVLMSEPQGGNRAD